MQFLTLVVSFADTVPKDEDVKAGWLAFAIFIGLVLAVAFLGFSLVKQLRKVDAAEEAGLYDPSDKKKPQAPSA
jgi:predicted permease